MFVSEFEILKKRQLDIEQTVMYVLQNLLSRNVTLVNHSRIFKFALLDLHIIIFLYSKWNNLGFQAIMDLENSKDF